MYRMLLQYLWGKKEQVQKLLCFQKPFIVGVRAIGLKNGM